MALWLLESFSDYLEKLWQSLTHQKNLQGTIEYYINALIVDGKTTI